MRKVGKQKQKKKQNNLRQAAVRKIAILYYVIQYAIVHVLFFGFVLDPVEIIERAIVSLNWSEILNALFNFGKLYSAGITFKSVLILIPLLIWYVIVLIWSARYLVIYLFVLVSLIRFVICLASARNSRKRIKLNKQAEVHDGAPGTGKTWSLVLFAQILSRLMWDKLSWLHWRDKTKVESWKKNNNQIKLADWAEIEESYNYYTTPQTVEIDGKIQDVMPIKCMHSNIGIEQNGRWSSKLTFEHAAQLERVPSYTISLYSEFGTTFSLDYSTNKQDNMGDDLRFCRQFRENVILGDEQEATNIMKDARRVLSDVIQMDDCKIIMQPLVLNIVFKPLKWFFSKTQIGINKKFLTDFMTGFERFINMVGFVKFKFHSKGGPEHTNKKEKRGKFVSPMWNTIRFDTRAFRFLADARHKPIKSEVHTDLTVENTPGNRRAFLRAEVKNRPEIYFNTNEKELMHIEDSLWSQEILKDRLNKYRKAYPEKYKIIKMKLEGGTNEKSK